MWYALDANNIPYPVDVVDLASNKFLSSKNSVLKQEHVQIVDIDYRVSTVFLALNHNWSSDGPPELWETMIFTEDKELNNYLERYSTYEQALAGHNKICDSLRLGITESDRFGEVVKAKKQNGYKALLKTLKNLLND